MPPLTTSSDLSDLIKFSQSQGWTFDALKTRPRGNEWIVTVKRDPYACFTAVKPGRDYAVLAAIAETIRYSAQVPPMVRQKAIMALAEMDNKHTNKREP